MQGRPATTNATLARAAPAHASYHRRMRIAIGLVAACALGACAAGGGNRPAGDDGSDAGVTGTLTIATTAGELLVMNGVAAHATFTATLTASDSTTRDVTADTTFSVDPLFGSFTGNDLATSAA